MGGAIFQISEKWPAILVQWQTDSKSCTIYRMVSFSKALNDW